MKAEARVRAELAENIAELLSTVCSAAAAMRRFQDTLEVLGSIPRRRSCKSPDCGIIFWPRRKDHVYHTSACASRDGQRRRREQIRQEPDFGTEVPAVEEEGEEE